MTSPSWKQQIRAFDDRRDLVVPKDPLQFCVDHFLQVAQEAIDQRSTFAVALSGGSTPKALFEALSQPQNSKRLDWAKVLLFWSDERCVPPYHADSNYRMAMESGLKLLPILPENIFRMRGEADVEEEARRYDELLRKKLPGGVFDLVMLGMGEDGHIASLFPKTHALHTQNRLAIANYIPSKETWRLTLTFECINAARDIVLYVMGRSKAAMLKQVLEDPYTPDDLPAQRIGTSTNKALWVTDASEAGLGLTQK